MIRLRQKVSNDGVTGLATAATVVVGTANATDALAYEGCCNLAHNPPNISYSKCRARAAYIWSCDVDAGGFYCQCCETSGDVPVQVLGA
jgi:hypothetical protein